MKTETRGLESKQSEAPSRAIAPSKFAHVVYKTHKFAEMIEWYVKVFNATVQHRDARLAFLTYDAEHHRFAFINLGEAREERPRRDGDVGVHHVAYTWRNLGELLETYKRLKGYGILPAQPIRHGLTLSLYYTDPDRNMMEFQVDLMEPQAANDFMAGPAFSANPIGERFDPDELLARFEAGQPVDSLIFRSDQAESAGTAYVRSDAGGNGADAHPSNGRAHGQTAISPKDYLAEIDKLLPAIRARAAETEALGRVPDETIGELARTGVFRAVQPRQFGGLELDPATFFEGMVRIGSACGSTGWVASVVGVHPFHIAMFPEQAQREVWQGNPDARASSSYAPTGKVERVDGGFVLSGRWGFSSGVDHCQWAILGGVLCDNDTGKPAEFRSFLVPRPDFEIDHQSWQVSGLMGSGSKDVVIKEAFVPGHRTHSIVDVYNGTDPGLAVNRGPLYKLPWLSMFAYAITSPAIGAAVGALNAFIEETSTRVSAFGGAPVALNPAMHVRLADAHIVIGDARARLHSTWNACYAIAQTGQRISVERRAELRYEGARSIGACLEAVLKLFEAGGGRVMQTSKPLQRHLRDILAMRNHPFGIPEPRAGAFARVLLGVPPEPFKPYNAGAII
jgi:3-hydroxy-9,10-secoandrosta-1,3,5(10)-triene-9,17-dione monooxygenase